MIADEVLATLVPAERPPDGLEDERRGGFATDAFGLDPEGPEGWEGEPDREGPRETSERGDGPSEVAEHVAAWTRALRRRLRERLLSEVAEPGGLWAVAGTSAFIGTGIFAVLGGGGRAEHEGFPEVEGLQFGVVLLRGALAPQLDGTDVGSIDVGGRSAPVVQVAARTALHVGAEGRIAAYFEVDGARRGITAGHVVAGRTTGQLVDVRCRCGLTTRLVQLPLGLVDAAVVEVRCDRWWCRHPDAGWPEPDEPRPLIEAERVLLHLDGLSPRRATVMLALHTPSALLTAAAPQHFLTDEHGQPGDSGSPVQAVSDGSLGGMYLGATVCQDPTTGAEKAYGYGLDMCQAARILGVTSLRGAFDG